jgi:integrase
MGPDRSADISLDQAALMKSDAEHRVPLSKAALAVLDRIEVTKDDSEYVFPNSKGKPLSDASMAAVIDRMNELERRWIDPKLDREIVPHGFRSSSVHLLVGRRQSNRICHSCPRDGCIKEAFVISL